MLRQGTTKEKPDTEQLQETENFIILKKKKGEPENKGDH